VAIGVGLAFGVGLGVGLGANFALVGALGATHALNAGGAGGDLAARAISPVQLDRSRS